MTQLAERLSACIAGRYSYGELAKRTGIPKSALQRYATGETEKIPLDRVETLARVLGVSPQWLMDLPSDGPEAPRPVSPILPVYDALNDAGKKELCRYGRYLTALEMKNVIRCGPAAGPAFMKTLNEPGIKRHNWFVNREANLYYFYFQRKGMKHLIVLELTQEMVDMIRSKSYLQKGVWYDADGKQSSLGPAKLSNG